MKKLMSGLPTIAFMIATAAWLGGSAFSAPRRVEVLSVVKGRLMAESTRGGGLHPAGAAQKAVWRKAQRNIADISPDGKYRCVPSPIAADSNDRSFHIIETQSGREVSIPKVTATASDSYGQTYLDGWLPDSIHLAVFNHVHDSSEESYRRGIVDVRTGQAIPFNGWLSPDGRLGIVPNSVGWAADMAQHEFDSPGKYVTTDGDLKWYVTSVPRDVASYRANPAARKLISYQGKPFGLSEKAMGTYAALGVDAVAHGPVIEFSRDDQWAICHSCGTQPKTGNAVPIDYLISLSSGKVRKLVGSQARFG